MAYDPADGYVVLFGGFNGSGPYTPLNDTWAFQHGAWTRLHPGASPPWLLRASMAYDAADGYVVMFGGMQVHSLSSFPATDQTWAFRAGNWTNLSRPSSIAASPRYESTMSYDPVAGSVVPFGGRTSAGAVLNDTWLFKNGAWAQATLAHAPGPTIGAAGAFSAAERGVVLLGGAAGNETWLFSNGSWQNLSLTHSPPARGLAGIAPYDAAGDLVLFGGTNATGYPNDSWTFSGGAWTELPLSIHPIVGTEAAVASDPKDGYVLWFGGDDHPPAAIGLDYFSNGTWVFGPSLLAKPVVSPNPSDLGQVVSLEDPYNNATAPYAYAWDLDDGNQSTLQRLTHLYARPGAYNVSLMVRDARGDYNNSSVAVVVNADPSLTIAASPSETDVGYAVDLSARISNGTAPFRYAWTLGDGNGSNALSPSHSYAAPGLYNISLVVTDAVGVASSAYAWENVSNLPVAALAVSTPFADVGQNVTFTASDLNGTGPVVYAFWGVPASCPTASGPTLVCPLVAPGNYTPTATASDAVGATSVAVPVSLTVSELPSVTLSASRAAIDLGQSVTLLERTVGSGSGGLTYGYQGLPPGCPAPTYPYYTCTPARAGNYTVTVTATDRSGGAGSSSAVRLVVNGALKATLDLSRANLTLGGTTTVTAVVAGGTAPFRFTYFALPPGCADANQSTLSCTPNDTGEWNVTVRVTDATGATAEGNGSIAVTAPATTPSGAGAFPIVPGVVGVVIAAAVAVVILVARRRRRLPDQDTVGGQHAGDEDVLARVTAGGHERE